MKKYKVLIVDDELLIRDLLYDFFSSRDLQIMTADNADEAMSLLEENPDFDVVLTDLKMEGYDGLSLADKVRRHSPQMPVIVMTGYPSVETAVDALRKRVYDYVVKPFNINRLYATVKAACEEHHSRQQVRSEGGQYASEVTRSG